MINWSMYLVLFIFGTAIGSFLNVVILRFNPEKLLFSGINGRSHCMACGKILKWYELMPLFSFLIQFGRCRACRAPLTLQYPIVEFLSGVIFVLVPYVLIPIGVAPVPYFQIVLWILVFLAMLLISVIDFHLYIIPDGLNISIAIFGIANFINTYLARDFGSIKNGIYRSIFGSHVVTAGTFLGTKAGFLLFFDQNIWLNFALGAVFGAVFFGAIYFLSRGMAMGFGDVKLAVAAGLLLGLPDIILATMLAFILGGVSGAVLMLMWNKGMKDHLPFGPFIVLGITLVFFFGYDIVDGYFRFFSFLG